MLKWEQGVKESGAHQISSADILTLSKRCVKMGVSHSGPHDPPISHTGRPRLRVGGGGGGGVVESLVLFKMFILRIMTIKRTNGLHLLQEFRFCLIIHPSSDLQEHQCNLFGFILTHMKCLYV